MPVLPEHSEALPLHARRPRHPPPLAVDRQHPRRRNDPPPLAQLTEVPVVRPLEYRVLGAVLRVVPVLGDVPGDRGSEVARARVDVLLPGSSG